MRGKWVGHEKIRSIELTRRPKSKEIKIQTFFLSKKRGLKWSLFRSEEAVARGGRQQRNRLSNSLPFEQFRQLAGALKRTEVESRT